MKKNTRMAVLCLVALLFLSFLGTDARALTAIYPVMSLAREASNNQVREGYERIEEDGICLQYQDTDERARVVLRAAQKQREVIQAFFETEISRLNIVLYPSREEMCRDLELPEQSIGGYGRGRIGVYWTNESEISDTLLHEICHYAMEQVIRANSPRWFYEGVALYVEYKYLGIKWAQEREQAVFCAREMQQGWQYLSDEDMYKQSFLLVKDWFETLGHERMLQIMRQMGQGAQIEELLYDDNCSLYVGL